MSRRRKKDEKHSVGARWTPLLADGGFTPVPQAFLENFAALQPPLTPAEALLVIMIVSFKWGVEQPWPSLKTLGTRMGVSTRYVRKLAERLESVGYLRRVGASGRSNKFDLSGLFSRLELVVRTKQAAAMAPPVGGAHV